MNTKMVYRLATCLASLSVISLFAEEPRRPRLVVTDGNGIVRTLQPTAGLNDGTDDGSATKGKDADAYYGTPNTNRGTGVACSVVSSDCNEANAVSYVRFSLAGMPATNIASAQIQIKMVVLHWASCGWPYAADPAFGLRNVTSDWNEMTLNWDLQPSVDPALVASQTVLGVAGQTPVNIETWLSYDITDLYKSWASGAVPNYGVRISHDNPFCMNCDTAYFITSDDGATKLTYNGATSGPYGTPATVSAILEDAAFILPVAGRQVSFTIGTRTCTGTSDSAGQASCVLTPDLAGTQNVTIAFAGDERYYSSSSTAQLTVTPAAFSAALSRTALTFGGSSNRSVTTPAQDVFLTMTGGSYQWSAVSNSAWLGVTPAAGQGGVKFSVSIVPSALPTAGTYSGKITVTLTGAAIGPLTINCTLIVKGAPTVPFGAFDTPADNPTGLGGSSAVSGSISVTGWALDDIGVKRVTIWRDPIGPEPVQANGYVYIGDSLFVPGARPDVEAAYPAYPRAHRAGWGYMMLTYGLPTANGIFRLHAIATDEEGNQVKLGTKKIVVDNVHSAKPFGALDSPAPGQTISGIFSNSGWALTPQPASIPADGSTIWVSVDGVYLAHPLFGTYRSDIASIFPGYANSNTSGGAYSLDTTRYSNAMHTVAWDTWDNQGHGDGIGSRYFDIVNGATPAGAIPDPVAQMVAEQTIDAERAFQLRMARLQRPNAPAAGYPAFRQGYDQNAMLKPIRQAGEGLLEPIELKELDRLELQLPSGQQWTAALRVGDELRALPIGSTFDAEGGIFYWQLGPAFLGEYTLEFRDDTGTILPVPVRVGAVSLRMTSLKE